MQILINIPEDRYDEIHSLKFVMYGLQSEENRKLFYRLINAVQDGTPLPDNATNLDVLKIMFPDYIPKDFTWILGGDGADWDKPKGYYGNWWNAPYQKGGKEND